MTVSLSELGDVRLPGLTFVSGGGVVAFLIRLALPPECFVSFLLFLSVFLLLLENCGCPGDGCSGLLRLISLINHGTADDGQCRKDCKEDLRVDDVQHWVSRITAGSS